MDKISKNEAWKIYEKLPPDLKQAIFSEETANSILSACQRNNLTEQQTSRVAEMVGYYLMGVLPIENLAQEIISQTQISQVQAGQIITELNRLVFNSIKNSLDGLYNLKTEKSSTTPAPQQKIKRPSEVDLQEKEIPAPQPAPRPKSAEPDTYREPVE
ncbi:MAG: hypothetical protein PHE77_00655 [Candidatus Pacebacteria bacterium]|nr:hypothetical protein [Candidatus Paceibacterota bacterium]